MGNGIAASCTEAAFNAALMDGGLITFNCGGAKTITFTYYKTIETDTTIDGGGVITLSGGNAASLFQVFDPRRLTLQNITLANGKSAGLATGAIENFGTTTISNSTLRDNISTTNGGAIANYDALNLSNTTLSKNKATLGGGGIYNHGGEVTITNSQILENVGPQQASGGLKNRSGSVNIYNSIEGGIQLTNSTVSGNVAGGRGGGLYITQQELRELTNVTISGNQATGSGGGIYLVAGLTSLNFVSVVSNTGGGLYASGGDMNLKNTLLANNSMGNCDGSGFTSLGHNLANDNNCNTALNQPTDKRGTNVALPLGALANNGGPTLTHLPLNGNLAINGGVC